MVRNYQRQHLAAVAAGYINGAGTTSVAIGCSMTRITIGQYAMVLPADAGLTDAKSFNTLTLKTTSRRAGSVLDETNFVKRVFVDDLSGSNVDCDIEMILFRSVESGR